MPIRLPQPRTPLKETELEFIQIIEIRSSKLDEMRALDDEWAKATEGKRSARRSDAPMVSVEFQGAANYAKAG